MELKVQCSSCRCFERVDPHDVKSHVGAVRATRGILGHMDEPDFTLERCLIGMNCNICGESKFVVDANMRLKQPMAIAIRAVQLALKAGMERSYVSDLERGTRNPSVRALGRLAEALGVQPHELLVAVED